MLLSVSCGEEISGIQANNHFSSDIIHVPILLCLSRGCPFCDQNGDSSDICLKTVPISGHIKNLPPIVSKFRFGDSNDKSMPCNLEDVRVHQCQLEDSGGDRR